MLNLSPGDREARGAAMPGAALALCLALLSLLAWTAPAQAQSTPQVIGFEDHLPEAAASFADCLFEPGPITSMFLATQPPNRWTEIFMLVRRLECSCSSFPGVLVPRTVSFRIHWGLPNCAGNGATVEVSVLGTIGERLCPYPDESRVQCGPRSHTIASPGGPETYTLALPEGCDINQDVFVRVKFVSVFGSLNPCLAITAAEGPCTPCEQYFTSFGFNDPNIKCSDIGGIPFWCRVDADCFATTHVVPSSWGRLKTVYR